MRQEAELARLGERVRLLRRERALTQAALARLAGVSRPYVSDIERGAAIPSMETLDAIATALGISLNELLADTGPP